MASSPVARVPKPAAGRRERIMTRHEMVRLLRIVRPALRRFLIGMRQSLARPQEIRSLRWSQLQFFDEGRLMAFVQTNFKSKRMRRNGGAGAVRVICVDARFRRLLERLRRQRYDRGPAEEDGFVFLNPWHQPWTADSVGQAMRLWTRRSGINVVGDGREAIVAYSLRHMSATLAARNAIQSHILAALMGHSSPVMTARYIQRPRALRRPGRSPLALRISPGVSSSGVRTVCETTALGEPSGLPRAFPLRPGLRSQDAIEHKSALEGSDPR